MREELLHLFSVSGTLARLCITGVTLFHAQGKASMTGTVADDVLAISALMFLISAYAIFFALRTTRGVTAAFLSRAADALFLIALTGMVASGFIMVYSFW